MFGLGLWKAVGPTEINNVALRLVYKTLENRIYKLFQGCLALRYHLKMFKIACTITLCKPNKDNYNIAKSYRPIALLDTLRKALEKIIAKQLTRLAEEYYMLPDQQIGARQQCLNFLQNKYTQSRQGEQQRRSRSPLCCA